MKKPWCHPWPHWCENSIGPPCRLWHVATVEKVHAIVLAGGSAFGLDAASGVVRYLEERGIGFPTGVVPVPIVPAAILFDLSVGNDPKVRPTADCGYRAAASATAGPVAEGNVGAGRRIVAAKPWRV